MNSDNTDHEEYEFLPEDARIQVNLYTITDTPQHNKTSLQSQEQKIEEYLRKPTYGYKPGEILNGINKKSESKKALMDSPSEDIKHNLNITLDNSPNSAISAMDTDCSSSPGMSFN